MEFVDRGQSSGFGAGGLPRLVKGGDVVFDVLFGYGVRFVDAAGFEPINVFGDIGFVGGDGGRGESSLHTDVDEELLGESGESVGHEFVLSPTRCAGAPRQRGLIIGTPARKRGF